ncbi:hypothetical protein KIN20_005362 [Parelaphostrongylus tenuis]|uniref:SCP domain-containing protein n=1 Tax=Parelaphostrongylus tenuis TaxID=148309 RepID=A0AAD5ML87_PARTN|nr:hypothetical protein KIN20_005362 [Parelaphostrongylus tenuis]
MANYCIRLCTFVALLVLIAQSHSTISQQQRDELNCEGENDSMMKKDMRKTAGVGHRSKRKLYPTEEGPRSPMGYDCTLEGKASIIVKSQCNGEHTHRVLGNNENGNVAYRPHHNPLSTTDVTAGINKWWSEQDSPTYAQMTKTNATKVGCAFHKCEKDYAFVCIYA